LNLVTTADNYGLVYSFLNQYMSIMWTHEARLVKWMSYR